MNEDALQTEGSSDSFQNFLAQALLPGADLPDVQRAEGSIDSPKSKGVASNQASGSDTGLRRDVLPGQAAAVNTNTEALTSHPSSAAGSEHTPSADAEPPRGRGRGRGRQRKRVSGQGETAQQRAHRRFYERKKQKLAALEQEAAEKLALYQRLQRENAELKRKYDALTCTIAGRDEQMNLLQAMSSLCLNPGTQAAAAAAAARHPSAAAALMPGLDLSPVTAVAQQQQHQLNASSPHAVQSGTLPPNSVLAGAAGSSAHVSAHRRTGSDFTGNMHSQGQPPRHIAAAGPFGAVQLRAQDSPAAAAAPPVYAWQQPVIKPDGQMLMMHQLWPEQQQQPHQQTLQQAPPNLALTRSVSMPVPHHHSDRQYLSDPGAADSPATRAQDSVLQGQPLCNPPRAYNSSPYDWPTTSAIRREGGSFTQQQQVLAAAGALGSGWNAGPSRLQQSSLAVPQQQHQLYHPQQQQQQELPQQGLGIRPHSWSGPACPAQDAMAAPAALQRQSQSFPITAQAGSRSPSLQGLGAAVHVDAERTQQPCLAPSQLQVMLAQGHAASLVGPSSLQLQAPRQGLHTITTGGPLAAQQQQMLQRSGSDPAAMHSRQALLPQAQQHVVWQLGASVSLPAQQQQVVLPVMPPAQAEYGQQQQQQGFAGQTDLDQFGSLLPQPDDLMMLDEEMMMLLDKELSQQALPQPQQQQQQQLLAPEQSAGILLPPLDSMSSAGAEFPGAAAEQSSVVTGAPQQQFGLDMPGFDVTAAAASAAGSPPQTLLVASRLLQARHEAAGYFPAAAAATGDVDFCYVHQMVDWYRGKMHQLAELIPRVDRPMPDVAAGVALVQVVEEVIMACRKFGTRSRVGLWELGLINLETGDFEEAPPNHWRNVYHSLGFSADIRGKLDGCWGLYRHYMHKARTERQEVLREMAALEVELYGEVASADDDTACAGPFAAAIARAAAEGSAAAASAAAAGSGPEYMSQQQQQQQQQQRECPATLQFRRDGLDSWHAVYEKLQASMQREHMVANMIMYSCAQVASHIQMGRAMLNSYPYWPNGPAVLAVLHEEEQLAAAAAGRTAWPEPPGRMRSI